MKTHLIRFDQETLDYKTVCSGKARLNALKWDYDYAEITCENCKRTDAFKQAKAVQKRKEIDELKGEPIISAKGAGVVDQTYKQKIEIDVPSGWEFVRLGESKQGDFYIDSKGEVTQHNAGGWFPYELKIVVKPKVKQGAELIGCLSLLWDTEDKEPIQTAVITEYKDELYYCGREYYEFAIPAPAEKLAELQANLEREV